MTTFSTRNAVPSSAPKDLYDNAENLDAAINGSAPSWIDRLGQPRVSIAGALQALDDTMETIKDDAALVLEGIGYLVPVPYAAGLQVTSSRFTVDYAGDTYAASAEAVPFVTGAVFDPSEWRVVQGVTRSTLASSSGAGMVGFTVDGATARPLIDKLMDLRTVEDYGALGLPDVNDGPAFLKMAAATGGRIRMLGREYRIGNLTLPDYDTLIIEGAGRPQPRGDLSRLAGGSVLIGGLTARANAVRAQGFGVDDGSGRGNTGAVDGLVLNALVGQIGREAVVVDVASMGKSEENGHGILVQGFSRNQMDRNYCGKSQYGLVVKGRNGTISNTSGDQCKVALVYPKSDVASAAADVGDASARAFEISNTQHRASESNTTASAVYIHASTLSFSSARISNTSQTFGLAPIRFQGGGTTSDPAVSAVSASGIQADRCQHAAFVGGHAVDWRVSGISADNISTGRAVWMDAISDSWIIDGVNVAITDAAITGTRLFDCYGSGQWDNVAVRNPNATMVIGQQFGQLASVASGKVSGAVRVSMEGLLSGINGATAGTPLPSLKIRPGSVVALTGRFNTSALTGKAFCNLASPTGKQAAFACAAIDSAGNYTTVTVRLNDFQLTIEPSLPAGLQAVDLGGVVLT